MCLDEEIEKLQSQVKQGFAISDTYKKKIEELEKKNQELGKKTVNKENIHHLFQKQKSLNNSKLVSFRKAR